MMSNFESEFFCRTSIAVGVTQRGEMKFFDGSSVIFNGMGRAMAHEVPLSCWNPGLLFWCLDLVHPMNIFKILGID